MIKKAPLCLILSLVCLLSSVVFASAKTYILGDVNNNGKTDADDARLVLRSSVGLESFNGIQRRCADIDKSGTVTAADARLVLRGSVGLDAVEYIYISEEDIDDPEAPASNPEDSPRAAAVKNSLYDFAHQYYDDDKKYGAAFNDPKFTRGSPVELVYGTAGKWCCYYTIHDIFRPVLRKAGYSEGRIEQLAPLYYPQKTISTALANIAASEANDFKLSASLIPTNLPFYIPSVLMDYYQNASEDICTVYTLHEYYDDVVKDKLIPESRNASSYKPMVGDLIFMSNKSRTYVKGYPTVDHTAQIIKVNTDGTFLCTEGSISISGQPDELPRVRERWYKYSSSDSTYIYSKNNIVKVLACVRPKL